MVDGMMRDTMRQIVAGDPYAAEKVAKATEVLDRIEESGKRNATRLQATREAREAGLCGKGPRLAPQERETTTEGVRG